MEKLQEIFLLLILLNASNAEFSMKIQKVENCSSSQQTLYVDRCEHTECCMNFTSYFLKPIRKLWVSLTEIS